MTDEIIQHYHNLHVWTVVGIVGIIVFALAVVVVNLLIKLATDIDREIFFTTLAIPGVILSCMFFVFTMYWQNYALSEVGRPIAAAAPRATDVPSTADLGSCLLDHEKDVHASPSVPTSCTGQQHLGDSVITVVLTVGDGGFAWVRQA